MSMISSWPDRHVAVLAFPFGSHPRPLLSLLLKLATAAPTVLFSFFSTVKSNDSLFSSSNIDLPSNIKPYGVKDGVPAGHLLSGHPVEPVELFLKAATENFRRSINAAVDETGKKITCLISDAFLTFAADIAEDMHVPWVPVWASFPSSLSAHLYTDVIRQLCANSNGGNNRILEDQILKAIPGFSMMRITDLPQEVLSPEAEESFFSRTLRQVGVMTRATAVVLNSYEELNPEPLNNDLKSKFKRFLCVGFLTISVPPPPRPSLDLDTSNCLSWLDRQIHGSVAYISLGTVATLPHTELVALAEALEASGTPFLWSLKDHLKQLLPDGFVERTHIQGKIVSWAPQTMVLAHMSVGVFITHCGWNSVCESIVCGVPMIYRPIFGDHRLVGRMVEDVWEMGVKVEGGMITKDGLLNSLKLVLAGEQGKKMKGNVKLLQETVLIAAGPSSTAARNVETLLEIITGP